LHRRSDLPIRFAIKEGGVGYANFADLAKKIVAIATQLEQSEKKSDRFSARLKFGVSLWYILR